MREEATLSKVRVLVPVLDVELSQRSLDPNVGTGCIKLSGLTRSTIHRTSRRIGQQIKPAIPKTGAGRDRKTWLSGTGIIIQALLLTSPMQQRMPSVESDKASERPTARNVKVLQQRAGNTAASLRPDANGLPRRWSPATRAARRSQAATCHCNAMQHQVHLCCLRARRELLPLPRRASAPRRKNPSQLPPVAMMPAPGSEITFHTRSSLPTSFFSTASEGLRLWTKSGSIIQFKLALPTPGGASRLQPKMRSTHVLPAVNRTAVE